MFEMRRSGSRRDDTDGYEDVQPIAMDRCMIHVSSTSCLFSLWRDLLEGARMLFPFAVIDSRVKPHGLHFVAAQVAGAALGPSKRICTASCSDSNPTDSQHHQLLSPHPNHLQYNRSTTQQLHVTHTARGQRNGLHRLRLRHWLDPYVSPPCWLPPVTGLISLAVLDHWVKTRSYIVGYVSPLQPHPHSLLP